MKTGYCHIYNHRMPLDSITDRLHIGNRWLGHLGLAMYDNTARVHDPVMPHMLTCDSRAVDYPRHSPFSHCAGNPGNMVDLDGNAWQFDDVKAIFSWVKPQDSYDADGNLLPGLYEQAISFSAEGAKKQFNNKDDHNIGSSIATVYKADGSTDTFDACTYPSNVEKYPTIPEGEYEAKFGKHKGTDDALRMSDKGTENFYANSIELGEPNIAHKNRTTILGSNIHKAGFGNLTGEFTKNNVPAAVSEACILIDRNRWTEFIDIFKSANQKNNIIGISIRR